MALISLIAWGAAVLVGYALLKCVYNGLTCRLSAVPGPWYSRFTSAVYSWHQIRGLSIQYTHSLFERYGPLVRAAPEMVVSCDDGVWDEVQRMGTPFRKARFHERMRIGPEAFLFSITDVRQHSARRRLFARALTMDVLRRNWEARVRAKVDAAVDQIRAEAAGSSENGVADLFRWWRLMASDVIALLSFGESFDMVETAGEGELRRYFGALVDSGLNIVLRDILPWLPLLARVLPFRRLREIADADSIVTEKGTIAVRNLRSAGLDRANLFSNMLAEADKVPEADRKDAAAVLTDDAVRSEVAGFLIAGSDTTGFGMTMIVWNVLRRPELQRRLEDEVSRLDPDFTDKDVEKLPLLNSVIDETMRLYNPAGAGVLRKAPPEGATFSGHYLPGGTNVVVQHYSMCRNPEIFPDPYRFDETRFQNATERQRHVASPYGYGSRSCIGISLAKMELRLATATFFRKCRGARLAAGTTDDMMEIRATFFPYPKGHKCEITLVE